MTGNHPSPEPRSRSYSWEEISSLLQSRLNKSQHILTYGTIGSCNIEHDIDTIVTKKPGSPSALFFEELHVLFEQVNRYLQEKHLSRLIRTSRFCDEEEVKFIAGYQKTDLVFQVMTYVSMKQLKMHWFDASTKENANLEPFLKTNYHCLFGNLQTIFAPEFQEYKQEDLFIRLNDSDRLNSHFPPDFLIARMNVLYDFILRKRLGKETLEAKFPSECHQIFYEVCEILDSEPKCK